MKLTSTLKIAAATATVIGILLGFFERWFSPTVLVAEDSLSYPEWLGWAGWILASVAAMAYIVVDVLGSAGEKRSLDAARVAPHEPPPSKAVGNSDASGVRQSVS